MKTRINKVAVALLIISLVFMWSCGKKKPANARKTPANVPILVFEGEINQIEVVGDHSRIVMKDGRSVGCNQVPMNPVAQGKIAYIYKNEPQAPTARCTIWKNRQVKWRDR